jgi:hypothetical protein
LDLPGAGVVGGVSTIGTGSGILGGRAGLEASFSRCRVFMGNFVLFISNVAKGMIISEQVSKSQEFAYRHVEQTGVGLQKTERPLDLSY